ncbi:hypothetical protein [Micromonospora endolithica]|uniref:Uncharacterized protein n=1 Tax=Micromonospora endolithica TaxID=230091 RepID=A0A3A9ZKG3_9ACTN|nr:hypothetical protein [Micromonospora endolithica]RKN47796.1 hypothetical protein D7223_13720 [Micromonospora endolithica]TWJ21478.1 hypothetical protein JD76_01588 [Micromonospora endolithica]
MTVFTVRRSGGAHRLLDAAGNRRAALRAHWSMRGGQIETPEGRIGVWTDRGHRRVTVGTAEHPLVLLDGHGSLVAGVPAAWDVGGNRRRFDAVLRSGASRIDVHQPARPGAHVRADVTGQWPRPELVVLAACFGVMSLRRFHHLRTLAVVGAISHGPAH